MNDGGIQFYQQHQQWESAMETKQSNFERLAAINVNPHIEKKGNLSYLSWAWAVDLLFRADPDAAWDYAPSAVKFDDGTVLIYCAVTAFGKTRTMQLPVMDHRNKPIANPDAFQMNTAMQRCLVKAIALHGLGLYIYAGEDLPPGEEKEPASNGKELAERMIHSGKNGAQQTSVEAFEMLTVDEKDMYHRNSIELIAKFENTKSDDDVYAAFKELCPDTMSQLAMSHLLPSNVRSAIKRVSAVRLAVKRSMALASQP